LTFSVFGGLTFTRSTDRPHAREGRWASENLAAETLNRHVQDDNAPVPVAGMIFAFQFNARSTIN